MVGLSLGFSICTSEGNLVSAILCKVIRYTLTATDGLPLVFKAGGKVGTPFGFRVKKTWCSTGLQSFQDSGHCTRDMWWFLSGIWNYLKNITKKFCSMVISAGFCSLCYHWNLSG